MVFEVLMQSPQGVYTRLILDLVLTVPYLVAPYCFFKLYIILQQCPV